MENTMKLAIETYSKLTNKEFEQVVNECLAGNEVVIEPIQMMMFAAK